MKFSIGIPTDQRSERELPLPHLKVMVSDHKTTPSEFSGSDIGRMPLILTR
jgi:hypothetical protein